MKLADLIEQHNGELASIELLDNGIFHPTTVNLVV